MRRERGLAAVTAILIVAVAAGAAAMMLAQQSAMLDQTVMVASRAQAELFADAGLDWARGVLAEDARAGGAVDSLDEGWARPIAGLPIERAVVAGAIADEQGKMNLNNLVANGQPSAPDVRAFQQLLDSLTLPRELADAVVDWIDEDAQLAGAGGAEDAYYLSLARPYRAANRRIAQVEELYRVRGFDAKAVAALRPYVTALAARTPINANTAPERVLAAAYGVPVEQVAPLVRARRERPFREASELTAQAAKAGLNPPIAALDVKSAHFLVRVRVTQDDVQVGREALLARAAQGASTSIIWRRPAY